MANDIDSRTLHAVTLGGVEPARRRALLADYFAAVYRPAFPDPSLQEDMEYWLDLLEYGQDSPLPQPQIDVILLLDNSGQPAGGVTIELYRTARCGLLTYIAVHEEWRGKGLGRMLVGHARTALTRMAGSEVPMIAETERLADAHDEAERQATITRQAALIRLGVRLVDFDYVMPPLRPGSGTHRLHMLVFDPARELSGLPAAQIAALIAELADALGADLEADAETSAMMRDLAASETLKLLPLA